MELFKLFGTIAIQNADANDAIDDTTDKAEQSESKISSAFKKVGAAVATFFAVDKIKDFGLSCINASADAQAASSQFTQVFGDFESQASKSLSNIADTAGITENRMKGSYTKIAAFAKTTGMDTESALGLADRAMIAVADSAAFYDRSLEETTESLQSFLKGNYENDAALGLSCTETTRNAAANELYGKSFKDLSESQKQLTLLKMVEDANELSGALGQAARESDTWTNQTGNLQQAWTDFKAALGNNVLSLAVNLVKNMASAIESVTEKLPDAVQWLKEHEGVLKLVATAVGAVTAGVIAYKAAMAISSIISAAQAALNGMTIAQYALNLAMSLNPVGLVVAAIAALIAIVIACYNEFEGFRNIVNGVAEWIKSNLIAAFEFLKPYIEAIVTAVGELVSAIGERLMQAFQWIVDKITEVYNSSSPIVEAIKTVFKTAFENIQLVISTVFNVIKTVVTTVMTVVRQIIQTITAAINGDWSGVWNGIKNIFSTIWNGIKTIVTTVFSAIKTYISNVLNAIKSIFSTVWNGIKNTVSNVWNGIKTTVSNAINGVKSTISNGLQSAFNTVTNKLNSIKNKFNSIMNSAKSIVSGAISKIKGFFNFSWSLPKLKLPHPKISGKFSLNPPSVPKFSISWYKKAMDEPYMFTKPTVFDVNPMTGQAKGAGDAGDEIMLGKDTMMNMIRSVVASENVALIEKFERLLDLLSQFFPQVLSMMNQQVVLDSGVLVGELAPMMDTELGKIIDLKGRGN